MRYILALLSAFALTGATSAPVVDSPVIKGTIATATITMPTDDRMEGLSVQGGIAMIHTIIRARMVRTAIPFKANKPRRLSAHGYHIMLMSKLPAGSTLPMTLIFKNAGAVKVTFKVVG